MLTDVLYYLTLSKVYGVVDILDVSCVGFISDFR